MNRISILAGLVFGLINFWLLARIVGGLVQKQVVPVWKTVLYFFGKMALLFLTIGLILRKGYVTPLPFLAGFTVSLLVGILYKMIRSRGGAFQDASLADESQGDE